MTSRRHGPVYAVISGAIVGAILAVLVLATSPMPAGYQWPAASRVESTSIDFTQPGTGIIGTGMLPSDCTTMLIDLDSAVPVSLWVTPHTEGIPSGNPPPIPVYYYWSGNSPVTHVSSVVTITDPANGINVVVHDGSANQTGTAYFGFAFSASDCPQ